MLSSTATHTLIDSRNSECVICGLLVVLVRSNFAMQPRRPILLSSGVRNNVAKRRLRRQGCGVAAASIGNLLTRDKNGCELAS